MTLNGVQYNFPPSCASGGFWRYDGVGITCEIPTSVTTSTGVSLGILDGGTTIVNTVSSITFNGSQFIVSLVGSTTASIALDPSVVSLLGSSIDLGSEVTGSLPAASIAAGSLGASVMASSVAVNSVPSNSIVSLVGSKVTGDIPGNAAGITGTVNVDQVVGAVSVYPATSTIILNSGIRGSGFNATTSSLTVTGASGLNVSYGFTTATATVTGSTISLVGVSYYLPTTGGSSGQVLTTSGGTNASTLTWTSAGSGDITSVTTGYGLIGGAPSGAVTIALDQNTTSFIHSQTTLQSGATFYVSSGAVSYMNILDGGYIKMLSAGTTNTIDGTVSARPLVYKTSNANAAGIGYGMLGDDRLILKQNVVGAANYAQIQTCNSTQCNTISSIDPSYSSPAPGWYFGDMVSNTGYGTFIGLSSTTIRPGATLSLDGYTIAHGSVALQASVYVTSTTHLGGSAGTSGQVYTSGGPGAAPSWTTITSGSGGGSSLAVTTGTNTGFVGPPASTPTAVIVFDNRTTAGQLTANATYFFSLLPSSVTLQGQSVIRLQETLQTGATFYVSSGSVRGPIYANQFYPIGTGGNVLGGYLGQTNSNIGLNGNNADIYLNPGTGKNTAIVSGSTLAFQTPGAQIGIQAPPYSLSTNVLYTLPPLGSSGQYLQQSDSTGTLAWASVSGSGGGDNLGSHVSTKTITANYGISGSTFSFSGPTPSTVTYNLAVGSLTVTGSGAGVAEFVEGAAPSGVASSDVLYGDSTANWLKFIPNNGSAYRIVGSSNSVTPGNCAKFSSDGAIIDAGAACGTGAGGGGASGTINAASQFALPYYSLAGSTTQLSGYPNVTLSTTTGITISTGTTLTSSITITNVSNLNLNSGVGILNAQGVQTSTLQITGLTSQSCIGTDGSGNVQAGTCGGGGGASSLAVTVGVNRSSPTSDLMFNPNQFYGDISGSTITIKLTGNLSLSSFTATQPVLYDNTSGAFSLTPVSLSTGVVGTLPVGNGGTGLTSAQSATQPILYNSGTGVISATLISATTGMMGTVQAAQFPALAGDLSGSAGSLSVSVVDDSHNHTGTTLSAINGNTITTAIPSTVLPSTVVYTNNPQTISGHKTFSSSQTYSGSQYVSSTTILSNGPGSNGQVYTSAGPGATPSWTTVSGGGYATVQDEGSDLTQRTTLNFTGTGVSCADNAGSSRTDCTINSGAATAGGNSGNVQFNQGGSIVGASGFNVWDSSITLSTGTYTVYASTFQIDGGSFSVNSGNIAFNNVSTMTFNAQVDFQQEITVAGGKHGLTDQVLMSSGSAVAPKWGPIYGVVRTTSDYTTPATTAVNDIPNLNYKLVANSTYSFTCNLVFQTTATVLGARLSMSLTAGSTIAATIEIPTAADGTAGAFQGWVTMSGDPVTGTAVQAANTKYIGNIDGMIFVGSSGATANAMAGGEVTNGSTVIKAGSMCVYNGVSP